MLRFYDSIAGFTNCILTPLLQVNINTLTNTEGILEVDILAIMTFKGIIPVYRFCLTKKQSNDPESDTAAIFTLSKNVNFSDI